MKLNLTVNSLVFRTNWTVFFVRYEPKSYIFKLNEHPYLRLICKRKMSCRIRIETIEVRGFGIFIKVCFAPTLN